MADDAEVAAARAAADAVLDRARNDAAFSEQLRSDPATVLTAAGIDPGAAAQFGDELTAVEAPEVQGYMRCTWGSCWVTVCNAFPGTGREFSDNCPQQVMVGGVRG
jgi:hypothetical protein